MTAPSPHHGDAGSPPPGRPVSPLTALRDRHHRVASLLAAWAAPEHVAGACPGLTVDHARTLARSPAMLELVAAKRTTQKAT